MKQSKLLSPLFISAETPRRSICHHNLKTFTVLPGEEKKNFKKSQLQSVRKLKYNHSYGLPSRKKKQQQAVCFSEHEYHIFMTVLFFSSKQIYSWQKVLNWLPRSNSLIYPYATQSALIVQIFISLVCFTHDLQEHGSAAAGQQLSLCACSFLEPSHENQ